MRQQILASFAAAVALAVHAAPVRGDHRYIDFLHGLQREGYSHVAIEYLEMLSAQGALPAEVGEVYELELGNSLYTASQQTEHKDEAAQWLTESRTHLQKFVTEHPQHPEMASALRTLANMDLDQGQSLIRQARVAKEPEKQAPLLASARTVLEAARPRLVQSVQLYVDRLESLAAGDDPDENGEDAPSQPPSSSTRRAREAREEAETAWLDSRMDLAMTDYSLGRTYADSADPARKAAYQSAALEFDNIYQQFREQQIGLFAHMWHGKVADEMGDMLLAEDIYDEVLAHEPAKESTTPTGFEPLYAQVQYFRLQILLKTDKQAQFLEDAKEWLTKHRKSRRTDGYQAISLDVAKALIAQAETATGDDSRKLYRTALTVLADMAKVRGPYQQDAILLRREHVSKGGEASEPETFDEALAVASAAAESGQWQEAATAFLQVVELGAKEKDQDQVLNARYQLARAQYFAGRPGEALDTAEKLAHEESAGKIAPAAGAFAVSAAFALYAQAQDKAAALDRLTKIADYVVATWPDRAEADDARISLGQACLVRGDVPAALAAFENINPQSDRHAAGLFQAGKTYWRLYLQERAKPQSARDADAMAANRQKADERLRASLDAQRAKQQEAVGQPLPQELIETQLLLGEIALEGGQPAQAVELLQPLADSLAGAATVSLDQTSLRIIGAAVRANVAQGDFTRAGQVAGLLLDSDQDTPQVNTVLVQFTQQLTAQWKRAEAKAIEAQPDEAARLAAQTALADTRTLLSGVLDKLALRQQHSLAGMVFVADNCAQLALTERAREVYKRILDRALAEPAWVPAKGGAAAITRVRAQLVGLLRAEGNFAEALIQAEQLIEEHPNALEPLMEKGRILHAQAEQDPQGYDAAIKHWTMLRNKLSRAPRKPPEYFEVVYQVAACLVGQARPAQDKIKAGQAEQLLKTTLVLSPALSGPDMVARYDALLSQALELQGRARPSAIPSATP